MKIYAVKPDTKFRLMFPEDAVYDSDDWEFKCEPLSGKLPLHFNAYFSDANDKPIPDIAWIGMCTFAFRDDVATELLDILEQAGELLPFRINDRQWYCLNILQKADDALDHEKSKYEIEDDDMRFGLKSPFFKLDRLPKSSLFKIKADNYTTTYCADNRETDDDVLDNFFCAIAAHGYTGIMFEEVFEA